MRRGTILLGLLWGLIYLLSGCSFQRDGLSPGAFKSTYSLEHVKYDTELFVTGFPRIFSIDSFVLVISSDNDGFGKIFAADKEMKLIGEFGKIGNGPFEFQAPLPTFVSGTEIGINDLNKNQLAIIQLLVDHDSVRVIEKKRLKAKQRINSEGIAMREYYYTKLVDSMYVALASGKNGEFFSIYDSILSQATYFGESPINANIEPLSRINRLGGKIACHDGNMVYGANNFPYVGFYSLSSGEMEKKWSCFIDDTYFEVRGGDLLFSRDRTFGQVLDVAINDRYVFVLYLDILLSQYDAKESEQSYANKICVFDHLGNRIAIFNLDCRIGHFALSSNGSDIYGIAQLPDFSIVKFEMPQELLGD